MKQSCLGPPRHGPPAGNLTTFPGQHKQKHQCFWSPRQYCQVLLATSGTCGRWFREKAGRFRGRTAVDGPADYPPDVTESNTRVEDPPGARIAGRSRAYRRRPCPECVLPPGIDSVHRPASFEPSIQQHTDLRILQPSSRSRCSNDESADPRNVPEQFTLVRHDDRSFLSLGGKIEGMSAVECLILTPLESCVRRGHRRAYGSYARLFPFGFALDVSNPQPYGIIPDSRKSAISLWENPASSKTMTVSWP